MRGPYWLYQGIERQDLKGLILVITIWRGKAQGYDYLGIQEANIGYNHVERPDLERPILVIPI